MTEAVVVIGPGSVRGPGRVSAEKATAAIECIDDPIALVEDRPVSVAALWTDILESVLGTTVETLILVLPTWWSSTRTDTVCAAAGTLAANLVVLQRVHLLGTAAVHAALLVEIASDVVMIGADDGVVAVIPRRGDTEAVASAVVAEVGASGSVLLDAPAEVLRAMALGAAVVEALRARGVVVWIAQQDWASRAANTLRARDRRPPVDVVGVDAAPRLRVNRRVIAVTAGIALSAAILCGGVTWQGSGITPRDAIPMTLLVEGRVGLKIPASWLVRRVTAGPGSARVQVISATDQDAALHLTQARLPTGQTLAVMSETLRGALDEQPADVFVEFDSAGRRADRPVVTYREIRLRHHIEWSVLIDNAVRIGVGCQSAPDRLESVRYACDEAIRSAHAVG